MNKVLKYTNIDLQYYPTPPRLIKKILEELSRRESKSLRELEEINFLEVCAGDGAICREVKEHFKDKEIKIDCIEIEKVLRDSLKGQGFNVICKDFEEFEGIPIYDLIVMNPPFKKGAKFLLKAYKFLAGNGKLICILNSETIKNPCNRDRELLKELITRRGEVKFLDKEFSGEDSKRKTEVEIAVVYLNKPNYENEFDMFGSVKSEIKTEEEKIKEELKETLSSNNGLITFDKVDNAISLYRNCVKQIFQGIDTIKKIKTGLSYVGSEAETFNIKIDDFFKIILENEQEEAKEKTTKLIRKMVWSYVLKFCDMDKYLFSKHKSEFYEKLEKGSINLPFTKDNIKQFFDNIFHHRNEYLKKGIKDLFNEITSYHNGNSHHREGWKTNKNWKINKKIIVNWGISFDTYKQDGSGKFSLSYSLDWLNDLDKIVRKIGKDDSLNNYFIKQVLRNKFYSMDYIYPNEKYDNEIETPYFKLKFFKKGSLHITFKDNEILNELNIIGANLRRELGYDDFGKKSEKDKK